MQIKDSENDCQQVKTDLLILLVVTNAFNNALHKLILLLYSHGILSSFKLKIRI